MEKIKKFQIKLTPRESLANEIRAVHEQWKEYVAKDDRLMTVNFYTYLADYFISNGYSPWWKKE